MTWWDSRSNGSLNKAALRNTVFLEIGFNLGGQWQSGISGVLLGSGASSSANQLCFLGQVSALLWALVPHLGGERAGMMGSHATLMSLPLSCLTPPPVPLGLNRPQSLSVPPAPHKTAVSMKEHPYLKFSVLSNKTP